MRSKGPLMSGEDRERKLIRKVISGDEVEQYVFEKRYRKYIKSIIAKKVGQGSELKSLEEDIYQYVFEKLFEKDKKNLIYFLENFQGSLKTFLSFFVGSRSIDFIRKASRNSKNEMRVDSDEGIGIEEMAYVEDYKVEGNDLSKTIEIFLSPYPKENRDVFRLMCKEAKAKDMASELGLSITKIYQLRSKMKNDFRIFWKGLNDG